MRKFVLLFLILASPLIATTTYYVGEANCGCNCNTANATYILTQDMNCSTTTGLTIGANNITIDFNNHCLSGPGNTSSQVASDTGIYSSPMVGYRTNVTIQNAANISGFFQGIYNFKGQNWTIQNSTISNNFDNGIWNYNGSGNTLYNVTSINNGGYGLIEQSETSDVLLQSVLAGNGGGNFYFQGTNSNLRIDANNTVEGLPVLYLNSASNQTYSGSPADTGKGYAYAGPIGMFVCQSCNDVNIINATLSPNNSVVVWMNNTANSTIQNVNANSAFVGVYLTGTSANDAVIDCNFLDDYVGYSNFSSGTGHSVLNNYFCSDAIGLSNDSSGNADANNIFVNCLQDIQDTASNIYIGNATYSTPQNRTVALTPMNQVVSINTPVSFTINAYTLNGSACSGCTTITTSPAEPSLSYSDSGGTITGSFTPTRNGIYSLDVVVADPNNNKTYRNYLFFVGSITSSSLTQYPRLAFPVHGQPRGQGNDCKVINSNPPTQTEIWRCGNWVQNSMETIPNYPLCNISSIGLHGWYVAVNPSYGIQRYVTYDGFDVDANVGLNITTSFTWADCNFGNLNWGNDYPQNWYWITGKLASGNPGWETNSTTPSYLSFNQQYPATPTIISFSDPNIIIYSATSTANDSNNLTIATTNYSNEGLVSYLVGNLGANPYTLRLNNGLFNVQRSASGQCNFTVPYFAAGNNTIAISKAVDNSMLGGQFGPTNFYRDRR